MYQFLCIVLGNRAVHKPKKSPSHVIYTLMGEREQCFTLNVSVKKGFSKEVKQKKSCEILESSFPNTEND